HSPPPLSVRLQWAYEIAEGLAFVHSRGVVWVDVALNNVLLSTDLRAIISDFAGLLGISNQRRHNLKEPTSPPRVDLELGPHRRRFGFGIVLFSLLTLRFPHSPNLVVQDFEFAHTIYLRHKDHSFDTLGDVPEYGQLEAIIQKCFRAWYQTSDELVEDLRAARAAMVCLRLLLNLPNE
ncbi:hypothetical protein FB451DRAFT_1028901, partial [Mycena latifolia]